MDKKNTWSIKDLNVASYLFASEKVEYMGAEEYAGRMYFYFKPQDTVRKLIDDYYVGNVDPIQPKALFDAKRSLQDIIRNNLSKYEKDTDQET